MSADAITLLLMLDFLSIAAVLAVYGLFLYALDGIKFCAEIFMFVVHL